MVDRARKVVIARVPVGRLPRGIAISPDGSRLYVANSWSDNISEIDSAALRVVRTLPAGFEPTGVAVDRRGEFLYAANRLGGDVSVIDLRDCQRRSPAGGRPRRQLDGRGGRSRLRHPHLPQRREIPHAAGIGNHRHRYRFAQRVRPACPCTTWPESSTSHSPGMGGWESPRKCVPRI